MMSAGDRNGIAHAWQAYVLAAESPDREIRQSLQAQTQACIRVIRDRLREIAEAGKPTPTTDFA